MKNMKKRISFLLALVMMFAMLAVPANAVEVVGDKVIVSDAEVEIAIAESVNDTVSLDFSSVNQTVTAAEMSAAALAHVEATGKSLSVFNGIAYLEVNHAALSTIVAQTGNKGTITLAFELLPVLNVAQMAVMDQMLGWFATSIMHDGKQLDVGTDGSITVIIPESFVGAMGGDAYSVAKLDEKGKFHVVETKSVNGNLVAVLTEMAVYAVIEKPEPAAPVNPFVDVADNAWYMKPVLWAVDNGITGGTSPTTFGPDNFCTRAQVVTFLYAAAGKPEVNTANNPFADVADNAWYLKPVLWAVENGITGGTSATTFGPENKCTRAQVVTFLYADAGKPEIK